MADAVALAVERFHAAHRAAYGRAQPGELVEFVNLRAVAGRSRPGPPVEAAPAIPYRTLPAARRPVWFSDGAPTDTPVFARADLPASWQTVGPAVIEQSDTTTVVYPGQTCVVHASGALILTWEERA